MPTTIESVKRIGLVPAGTFAVRVLGFGGLRVESVHRGGTIALSGSQPIALLFLLLAQPQGRFVDRNAILRLLWPTAPPARARHRLRQVIHELRRSLGRGAVVSKGRDYLAIDHDVVQSDLTRFRECVENREWAAAKALYRGDLLPGFVLPGRGELNAWLDSLRAELARLAEQAGWRTAVTLAEAS